MINLINEQVALTLEELELITDPYQRGMVRTQLIGALSNINLTASFDAAASTMPTGKDAIKADIPKEVVQDDEPIKFEEVPAPTPVEEEAEIVEEKPAKKETKKKTAKKKEEAPAPVEVDVDPNTPEESEEETNEPIVVQVEDEEGNVIDLDITEAWNTIAASMQEAGADEDTILEVAQNLTAYNLMPIYSTLESLNDSNDKMMLSYYMQELGLDEINPFIARLSDGQFDNIYEFINNDNLEYVVSSIAEAMEE